MNLFISEKNNLKQSCVGYHNGKIRHWVNLYTMLLKEHGVPGKQTRTQIRNLSLERHVAASSRWRGSSVTDLVVVFSRQVTSNSYVTLWIIAHQPPLSMGFPRQEYWSGLSFASPGDIPDPGIEPAFLASLALAGRFFTTGATWKPV